jgi:outer membrane receptor protein involved in Fe transport
MSGVAVVAFASVCAVEAQAQTTTSEIRGVVRTGSGAPAAGARVNIVHQPTGTSVATSTGAGGEFSASGLRVGGPYTVSVSGPDGSKEVGDIFLSLGDPYRLNLTVESTTETIIVTASAAGGQSLTTGPASSFTLGDIANFSSITRDFRDVVQRDPLAYIDFQSSGIVELRVAGTNPRFNSVTVDGLRQNDNFGLNNQGFPTARAPLSVDFVDQVTVETAPYDVEYSGFTGANINAVTKSGTNEFHGSASYFFKDDSLVGDSIDGVDRTIGEFEDKSYSLTLGGPILQDRLFFFAGYENVERTTPITFGLAGSNAGTIIPTITQADVDQVLAISRDVYGFDPLDFQASNNEPFERYIGKIDWNINADHRASFTYQKSEGSTLSTRFSTSQSQPIYGTPSNWYDDAETLTSYVGEVFSNWTDNLSTEIKIGYSELVGDQAPLAGADFPEIYVGVGSSPVTTGSPLYPTRPLGYIVVGPDQFRHANELTYDTTVFKAKANYTFNNHLFSGGVDYESIDFFNLFVEGSDGIYRFDSIADFEDGLLADALDTRFSAGRGREPIRLAGGKAQDGTLDVNAAAASFDLSNLAFYAQDEWNPTDVLTLIFGLRYETLGASEGIPLNPTFESNYGFANTNTIDGLDILLPRFGFSYEFSDDITIKGGVGRFAGGAPNVWISNNYSNNGVSLVSTAGTPTSLGLARDFLAGDDLNVEPAELTANLSSATASGAVNALDPDFEIPSIWRANVGVDVYFDVPRFGDDYLFYANALYAVGVDNAYYYDPRATVSGATPDGRERYTNTSSDLVLATTDKSTHSEFFTIGLQKDYEWGGSFDLSYTRSDAEEVTPLTSSTASSNQTNRAWVNFNQPEVGRSAYDREDLFDAYFQYEKAFFRDWLTSIGLFGQYQSGRPFSYTFTGTNWGEANTNRGLMYVPTGASDPNFRFASGVTAAQQQAFLDFLDSSGLSKYAGGIAERNEFEGEDYWRWDLRLSQELPGAMMGHRTELTLDVFNFGNLLNDEWGKLEGPGFPQTISAVTATYDSATDQYVFTPIAGAFQSDGSYAPNVNNLSTLQSLWQVQLGISYRF